MARGLLESEIGEHLEQILRGHVNESDSINTFVSKKIKGEWVVEFNFRAVSGFTIKVKNTGAKRAFKTLDAVSKWMERMAIPEFKVILD